MEVYAPSQEKKPQPKVTQKIKPVLDHSNQAVTQNYCLSEGENISLFFLLSYTHVTEQNSDASLNIIVFFFQV